VPPKTPAKGKKPVVRRAVVLDPTAEPSLVAAAEARYDSLAKQFDVLVEENAALRSQIIIMENQLVRKDVGVGEYDALVARLRQQRDAVTRAHAICVDTLRSTSVSVHSHEHRGAYDKCEQMFCRIARDQWALIGGVPGVTSAQADPATFWANREQGAIPTLTPIAPLPPTPADEEEDEDEDDPAESFMDYTPPPAPLELGEEIPSDPDLGPAFEGKRIRRIRVAQPDKEKDRDDPGMPKKARV
jgi:hypothetical protein